MTEARVDIGKPKDDTFESFAQWIDGLREQLGVKAELVEEDIEAMWSAFWNKEE